MATILDGIIESFEQKHPDFIQQTLQTIEENSSNNNDSLWKFGLLCLNIVFNLNEVNFVPNSNQCYLSINEERQLTTCCQLITCFCIHYNLEENVGVSIDRLSKFGVNISKKRLEIDTKLRNQRLYHTMRILLNIKQKKREHIDFMKLYFYPKYMHDIFCGIIQVCYSPNSFKFSERDSLIKWLEVDIFDETDGGSIVSNLLMAQSSSTVKNRINPWFVLNVGKLLTNCLLRPNSVISVIRAVLTELNALSTVELASDWKKCDIVARILTQCPREVNIETYFEIVTPQVLALFFNYEPRYAKHFYRVAGSIYALFSQRWPQLASKHMTQKIIGPLYNLENIIDAKSFKKCIDNLHIIYTSSTEPMWSTINQLPSDLIKILFQIYIILDKKVNCHKTRGKIEDILKLYIKMMPQEAIVDFLENLLLTNLTDLSNLRLNLRNFHFETYDDDLEDNQIVLKYSINEPDSNREITIKMVEKRCSVLVELLKSLNDSELEINFLLHSFSRISQEVSTTGESKPQAKNDQTLLNIENKIESESQSINLKIIYFTQLSLHFEKIDPQLIIDKYDRIIKFCKLILSNFIKLLKRENNSNLKDEQNELVHLIFSVLSVFTTGMIKIEYSVKNELQSLIPDLVELKLLYGHSDLSEMANSLYISIATYCGIKTESKLETNATSNTVLIEEVENDNECVENLSDAKDEYYLAMKDATDPLIPVRAHGLVALRKLIEKKDQKCLENKQKLTDLYMRNLKNEDRYF